MDDGLGRKVPWLEAMDDIVSNSPRISRVILFLHLAKTGGTTVSAHIASASDWKSVRMAVTYFEGDSGGDEESDNLEEELENNSSLGQERSVPSNWFCSFSHESYDSLANFREEITRRGAPPCDIYFTHRPARDRLASMFKDYWQMALEAAPFDGVHPAHQEQVRTRYRSDSVAYIDASGRIDGRAWFQAYASSGGGVPFSMAEVFGGSPMHFRIALAQDEVRVVPTRKLDDWLRTLTNADRIERRRVSESAPENVLVALKEARDLVEQISERDWAFDQAVDEYELMSRCGRRFRA